MALPAWPGTVNQFAYRASYSEKPERTVSAFAVDQGPELEAVETSIPTVLISYVGRYTRAEWDALMTFYRDTLHQGTLPFTRLHPDTGASITCKFVAAPEIQSLLAIHRTAPIKLRWLS